jgi:hypothetical protein
MNKCMLRWHLGIQYKLTMDVVNNWHTKQLDYVLAFPQAPVEREIYDYSKGIQDRTRTK